MRSSYIAAVLILLVWVGVALAAGQSITATQSSALLLRFGACDGSLLTTHEWWRLITSQWLHSKLMHMVFNAGVVALSGALLEGRLSRLLLWSLYVVGGSLAQLASVWAYPNLVTSGASQAMLILAVAALLIHWTRLLPSKSAVSLLVIIALQIALDVKDAGAIKIGHAVAMTLGFAVGAAMRFQVWRRTAVAL